MALSDPFQTVYEGGLKAKMSLGEGIQSAVGALTQGLQRNRTMDMLKQFGILKEKPLTIDDYKKAVEEQTGGKGGIDIQSTLPENEQIATADKLIRAAGLKPPKSKGVQIDLDKAQEMGMAFSPITGELIFKPAKREKSLLEQINEAEIAKSKGLDYKSGKVTTPSTGGYGAAQLNYARENSSLLADAVEQGDYGAIAGLSRTAITPVVVELRKRGHSVNEALLGFKAMQSAVGNTKIVDQKVMNAGSAQVLLNSSYDPKTGNYVVPPSMHAELAIATARMLSPTGVVSDDRVDELRQVTAREGLAKAAIWMGFSPSEVGGSTQSVINMFAKTIKREGEYAQQVRDKYIKGGLPTMEDIPLAGRNITDTTGLTKKLPPKGATHYSPSTKKYYDAKGNEVK